MPLTSCCKFLCPSFRTLPFTFLQLAILPNFIILPTMFFFLLLPLIELISTTQAQYTQQNVSNIITFDNSCSDAQKGVVLLAMQDAFSMADLVRGLPDADINDGPAFM
jgi:hypothetical protein